MIWSAGACPKSTVTALMRIEWTYSRRDRGGVSADAVRYRFGGVAQVGIDGVSYRKGQNYLIVVVEVLEGVGA
ncbi:hypothetical protein [Kribbella sp. NBC_00359]|uniref:hypothetical protein n=1 Tax=Kribbella sp. NBC_00359 TaxID=2975966 RepID=UPI002E1DBEED